jgi:hypothetical protein
MGRKLPVSPRSRKIKLKIIKNKSISKNISLRFEVNF